MLALSLPALLLGLGCGLLYSVADALRKAAPASCPPLTILFYYMAGHIPVLGAWVLISGETAVAPGYLLPGAIDAIVGLGANILFIVAIRRSALSLMVPLLALVPVFTLLFGGLFLGEWPTIQQDLGILLIGTGLFALFQPPSNQHDLGAALSTLRSERGTLPMLGVVVLWSASPPLDKVCLAYTSPGMHSFLQIALIWSALFTWAALHRFQTLRLPSSGVPAVAGSSVAGALGYVCQMLAYSLAMVALIEVLKRAIGLLGSLALGRAAFREPLTFTKIAGIGIIAAGLPLVMLS